MSSVNAVAKLNATLEGFRDRLTPEELQNWHLMLSAMVGDMADRYLPPTDEGDRQAWLTLVRAIAQIYPGGVVPVPAHRAIAARLDELRAESLECAERALRHGSSGVAETGPVAAELNSHPEVADYLESIVGVPLMAGRSSHYFFYDRPGDYLMPHADPINSSGVIYLVNLEHSWTDAPSGSGPGSALIVYRPDGSIGRFAMGPGDGLVILGGGTVHARETVRPGERVVNVSLGYAYAQRPPSDLWTAWPERNPEEDR
jgi:hypothetical protein